MQAAALQIKSSIPSPMPSAVVPIRLGRCRMAYRWARYFLWCCFHRHPDGARDALSGLVELARLSFADVVMPRETVECNLCGWQGNKFYPNVGSGYRERDASCPRCHCIHRYRSLTAILEAKTDFFSPRAEVIEVAPVRSFHSYTLWRKQGRNYINFDLEKFGMEKGDLTAMRYADNACDYFLCFHVLEHVPADDAAVREIFRVTRPNGVAILQVPIDYSLSETIEYGAPNPRETGHVRRYSEKGFAEKLTRHGFQVSKASVAELFTAQEINRLGLSPEPVYLATKPS
jgi:SAM-dependent methyltransferase